MKKLNTNDIIAVIDGNDWSELRFATKDGEQALILGEPLEDGTRFIVPGAHDETETDCIHIEGEDTPLLAWCEITDIYGQSEGLWEDEANDKLAAFGLKLGDQHRMHVTIEGDTYIDGWFELKTI